LGLRKLVLWAVVAVLLGGAGRAQVLAQGAAQDLAGSWQGTLSIGGGKQLRVVLQVSKAGSGWSGTYWSIDQSSSGIPVGSIALNGSDVRYMVDAIKGSYEGKLSADGSTITGSWTQPPGTLPLVFARATKETAWALPDPNWGHKLVAVDAKVFDGVVGTYQLSAFATVTVVREGEHLYLEGTKLPRIELFPSSGKDYFARAAPIEISFHTDEHGVATEAVVRQAGRATLAKRVAEAPSGSAPAK
jgi:hypothetical protein